MIINIDTERVIIEVRLRPVIWDKKNELYKNREARETAWKEILEELVPNYDSLSDEQRKDADKKIQQRWRTARDCYQKEKIAEKSQRFGSGINKKKKYSYSDLLTFLDNTIETKDNIRLIAVDESSETFSEESYLDRPNYVDPLAHTPQSLLLPPHPKLQKSHSKHKGKKIKTKLLECLRSNELKLESEDLAFFQSLQPTLKRYTRYQKLMFRTRVLNVVMEMENQIQHTGYCDPVPSTSSSSCTNYENMSPLDSNHCLTGSMTETQQTYQNLITSALHESTPSEEGSFEVSNPAQNDSGLPENSTVLIKNE